MYSNEWDGEGEQVKVTFQVCCLLFAFCCWLAAGSQASYCIYGTTTRNIELGECGTSKASRFVDK